MTSVGRRSAAGVVIALWVVAAAACGPDLPRNGSLAEESIFQVTIPGTTSGASTTARDGTITRLLAVTDDWVQVSVDLAGIVQSEGWTVTALNCVGTGNDVIAKKRANGEWLLLESGAGERGAGIIVQRDPSQTPPGSLTVTGRCPDALVAAVP